MTLAVVLAGGHKPDLIDGKHMVEYVVEAIRGSHHIDGIVIAGALNLLNDIFAPQDDFLTLVKSGGDQLESFTNALGVAKIRPDEHILIVAADIPLLTTEAIEDFISMCVHQEGEMFYPIVEKRVNEAKYPGSVRTYVKLREGIFTGGNLILIKASAVDKSIPVAEKLVQYRKSPLRLASYIGWGVLLRYLTGCLSVGDVEEKVSSLIGIRAVAVISGYAEIGIDVDKSSDLDIVKKHLLAKHEFMG